MLKIIGCMNFSETHKTYVEHIEVCVQRDLFSSVYSLHRKKFRVNVIICIFTLINVLLAISICRMRMRLNLSYSQNGYHVVYI
jgi:hypothetical protein